MNGEEPYKMKGVAGKNGFAINKKEGDGKSPIGVFSFGTAFGSQVKPAKLKISYKKTTKYDFWIDDVKSTNYNKWITYKGDPNKKWNSFERMNHELYKYGVVINYNTDPIIKGKGSAIFLHKWRNENGKTAGCVATSEKNILTLLQLDRSKEESTYDHWYQGYPKGSISLFQNHVFCMNKFFVKRYIFPRPTLPRDWLKKKVNLDFLTIEN